jgi:hypothetical protein
MGPWDLCGVEEVIAAFDVEARKPAATSNTSSILDSTDLDSSVFGK